MNFKHWSWHFEKKIRKSTLQEWCLLPTYLSKKTFFQSFRLRWKSFWRRCANERVKLNFFFYCKKHIDPFQSREKIEKVFWYHIGKIWPGKLQINEENTQLFFAKTYSFRIWLCRFACRTDTFESPWDKPRRN